MTEEEEKEYTEEYIINMVKDIIGIKITMIEMEKIITQKLLRPKSDEELRLGFIRYLFSPPLTSRQRRERELEQMRYSKYIHEQSQIRGCEYNEYSIS
jgi:hypothetical protein